jgi:hypothetical protein
MKRAAIEETKDLSSSYLKNVIHGGLLFGLHFKAIKEIKIRGSHGTSSYRWKQVLK